MVRRAALSSIDHGGARSRFFSGDENGVDASAVWARVAATGGWTCELIAAPLTLHIRDVGEAPWFSASETTISAGLEAQSKQECFDGRLAVSRGLLTTDLDRIARRIGPVTVSRRSRFSFIRPFVRMRLGFSSLWPNACAEA
ncbi:MAG: hypothetical protein AAF360_15600, partial [Pseudomonadota bacterium]